MGTWLILTVLTIVLDSVLCLPPYLKNKHRLEIYGGDPAKPGQFPFVVGINVGGSQSCGGSIINENWVVTAALCVVAIKFESLTILAGTTLYNSEGIVYNVSSTTLNPDFDEAVYANNIALVKIDGAFTFNDLVQPIEIGDVAGNDPVTVTGWGTTKDDKHPNELQYANLTALSDDDCTEKSEGGQIILPRGPGEVCSLAPEGIGRCYGDYGGPLIFNGTLVGIASYGVWPCGSGYPDVYTRIAYYVDWINETIVQFM